MAEAKTTTEAIPQASTKATWAAVQDMSVTKVEAHTEPRSRSISMASKLESCSWICTEGN